MVRCSSIRCGVVKVGWLLGGVVEVYVSVLVRMVGITGCDCGRNPVGGCRESIENTVIEVGHVKKVVVVGCMVCLIKVSSLCRVVSLVVISSVLFSVVLIVSVSLYVGKVKCQQLCLIYNVILHEVNWLGNE